MESHAPVGVLLAQGHQRPCKSTPVWGSVRCHSCRLSFALPFASDHRGSVSRAASCASWAAPEFVVSVRASGRLSIQASTSHRSSVGQGSPHRGRGSCPRIPTCPLGIQRFVRSARRPRLRGAPGRPRRAGTVASQAPPHRGVAALPPGVLKFCFFREAAAHARASPAGLQARKEKTAQRRRLRSCEHAIPALSCRHVPAKPVRRRLADQADSWRGALGHQLRVVAKDNTEPGGIHRHAHCATHTRTHTCIKLAGAPRRCPYLTHSSDSSLSCIGYPPKLA